MTGLRHRRRCVRGQVFIETLFWQFSYVDLDERVPAGHPLRKIRQIVNDALASLDIEFDALYTKEGRPSIAPERLDPCQPAADAVLDPVRAAVDGADGLQPVVPVVRRAGH